MLEFHINPADHILRLEPSGPLQASDFQVLSGEVDPYIAQHGALKGLLIHTPTFPGWSDFAAFLSHIRFVKAHHRHIKRIAAVTDSGVLSILPQIAGHFISAEVRHFDYADQEAALSWLKEDA